MWETREIFQFTPWKKKVPGGRRRRPPRPPGAVLRQRAPRPPRRPHPARDGLRPRLRGLDPGAGGGGGGKEDAAAGIRGSAGRAGKNNFPLMG